MELKQLTDKSWRIYHNGRCEGIITDFGKEWTLEIHYQQFDIPKKWMTKEELKGFIQSMIERNALEVYSEEKAIRRGFKILV